MDQLKEKIAQGYSLVVFLKQNALTPMMSKDSIKEHFTLQNNLNWMFFLLYPRKF
jgi:hypothetical protein